MTSGEVCDDGSKIRSGAEGCSADCKEIEPGWYCPFPGRPCRPIERQSWSVDAGAVYDGGSQCQPNCSDSSMDAGAVCDGGKDLCGLTCGNGVVDPGEECDDGWDQNDDNTYGGCTTRCKLGAHCGDGIVNSSEEKCDLGDDNGIPYGQEYGCTAACTRVHFCGDGIPDPEYGEACDLGELNGEPNQRCDKNCQIVGQQTCYIFCL